MRKILLWFYIPLFMLEFVAVMIIYITFSFLYTYHYPYNSFTKVENTMSLSKNHRNVIYIMVDMTTGFDVTSILQGNPKIAANFTGFTNYQNVITNNWGTNASVPNVFGGYDYNVYNKNHGLYAELTLKQYMKQAMNVLISSFSAQNWDISTIGTQYYDYNENKSYWDSNWQTLENDFKEQKVQAINSADVSRLLYYKYPRIYQNLKLPSQNFLYSNNANFIAITSYLANALVKETTNNKLLMIMDESNHAPLAMDEDGNYQDNRHDLTIKNVYRSTAGFMNKINNVLTYLKKQGIYDNTMIVINSDHGDNGIGSLPVSDPQYNYSGIDYSDIVRIEKQYRRFTRYFPTLLVKPFNDHKPLQFDNNYLYTNADALTFIKEYNANDVDFTLLDQTQDIRYLPQLKAIANRYNTYMPSYGNDSLWDDNFTKYLKPNTPYSGESFLVKKSIYDIRNYLVSKDVLDYYSPDDLSNWKNIT